MSNDRNAWRRYRNKGYTEGRPWTPKDGNAFLLRDAGISVSGEDIDKVGEGGMIFRQADNHDDQWYVNKEYFEAHKELAE